MEKYYDVRYLVAGQGPKQMELSTDNPDLSDDAVRADAKYQAASIEGVPERQITLMAVDPLN